MDEPAHLVGAHQHRDVVGAHRTPTPTRLTQLVAAIQQLPDLAEQVGRDEFAGREGLDRLPRVDGAHPHDLSRLQRSFPADSRLLLGRGDSLEFDSDTRGTEVDRTEEVLDATHHLGIRTVVGGQPQDTLGLAAGLMVGLDVAPAEAVDRLLGVADQHERGAAGEACLEEGPLSRIGVLELVHQHDREPFTEQLGGRLPADRIGEHRRQPHDHVVVSEDPARALPGVEHLANRRRETHPYSAGVIGRVETLGRVCSCLLADRVSGLPAEALPALLSEVAVGDHLLDQHARVGLQDGGLIMVGQHAQLIEHPRSEGVQCEDRGGVDQADRLVQPVGTQPGDRRIGIAQQDRDPIGAVQPAVAQPAIDRQLAGDEPGANAVAQFTGGSAGEGDCQDLVEGQAVGHVAGDQRGDGIGFAGACAGFQDDRGAGGGQRLVEPEDLIHRSPSRPDARDSDDP